MQSISKLHVQFENVEKTGNETLGGESVGGARGVITAIQFDSALHSAFPNKEDSFYANLLQLAAQQLQVPLNLPQLQQHLGSTASTLPVPGGLAGPQASGLPGPGASTPAAHSSLSLGLSPGGQGAAVGSGPASRMASSIGGHPEPSIDSNQNQTPVDVQLTEQQVLDAIGHNTSLEYKQLFTDDEEGRTGPFLEAIVEHQKQQRLQLVAKIKDNLTMMW